MKVFVGRSRVTGGSLPDGAPFGWWSILLHHALLRGNYTTKVQKGGIASMKYAWKPPSNSLPAPKIGILLVLSYPDVGQNSEFPCSGCG